MGVLDGLWLVLLGLVGVGSFVFRDAEGRALVLGLIQLGMGGWAALWGWYRMWVFVAGLEWIARAPVYWCTIGAGAAVELLLGLLFLGGVVLTLMRGRDEPASRASLRRKAAVAQAAMGGLALGLGIWTAVYGLTGTML